MKTPTTSTSPRASVFIDAGIEPQLAGLLRVVERLLPLRLGGPSTSPPVARIVTSLDAAAPSDIPTLLLPSCDDGGGCHQVGRIRFEDDPNVPWPFRGRTLNVKVDVDISMQQSLRAMPGIVLATDGAGAPLWRLGSTGTSALHGTAIKPPYVPVDADVGLAVGNERFVPALALFDFLRGVAGANAFRDPLLRASYIIDDPNLHWPTYGYADYRDIADSARRHHYHVAFATIPLDGWWVHPPTADIFRANPSTLSLLVHGNNHARQELAQDLSARECAALLRQAVARIELLEAKARLSVSRVMVPPHGACSARMLSELPSAGFESACISAGSLRAHNQGAQWTRSLGIASTEHVEDCPVLPRWAFVGTTDAILLTAAYLGQPLVLRGHHLDLKTGLHVMERFADTINALGHVHWGSLTSLSRRSYRHRLIGSTLVVEPISHRIDVEIPSGVEALRLLAGAARWTADGAPGVVDGNDLVVPAIPGRTIALRRLAKHDAPHSGEAGFPVSTRLILRRLLTETRDRLRVE
jgi:hypothetical protein